VGSNSGEEDIEEEERGKCKMRMRKKLGTKAGEKGR
jgi:hypothetical protein